MDLPISQSTPAIVSATSHQQRDETEQDSCQSRRTSNGQIYQQTAPRLACRSSSAMMPTATKEKACLISRPRNLLVVEPRFDVVPIACSSWHLSTPGASDDEPCIHTSVHHAFKVPGPGS